MDDQPLYIVKDSIGHIQPTNPPQTPFLKTIV